MDASEVSFSSEKIGILRILMKIEMNELIKMNYTGFTLLDFENENKIRLYFVKFRNSPIYEFISLSEQIPI